MGRDDLESAVIALTKPALAAAGLALVDLEFAQSAGAWVLRFFIDTTDGHNITIDRCTEASRLLDPLLDAAEVVHGAYVLEVSSPGINRRVRWLEDFARFADETVEMQFRSPLEGRRKLHGTLRGTDENEVLVEDSHGALWHVPLHIIKRATLQRL